MKTMIHLIITFIFFTFSLPAQAAFTLILLPENELYIFDITENTSIGTVKKTLEENLNRPKNHLSCILNDKKLKDNFLISNSFNAPIFVTTEITNNNRKGGFPTPRDYWDKASPVDIEYITYIISTLANKPLWKLAQCESSLNRAGDKVEHLHPLCFLHAIFSDEELKLGIYLIKKRSFVWKDFINHLSDSFQDEFKVANLKEEYLIDFSHSLGVDYNLLLPPFQMQSWKEFVITLIQSLPRKDQSNRYGI